MRTHLAQEGVEQGVKAEEPGLPAAALARRMCRRVMALARRKLRRMMARARRRCSRVMALAWMRWRRVALARRRVILMSN